MFSGTVKLLDLNDYIKPGEECVVLTKSSQLDSATKAYLNIDGEELKPDLIKQNTTDKAKININDCLACNGCITSSEAILVEEQSIAKFLEQHPQFTRKFVLLSPQSRASIAYHSRIPEKEVHLRLNAYFRSLGFEFIDDFALQIDIVKELEYSRIFGDAVKPQMCSECPGWICYLEKVLGDRIIPYASTVKTPQLFASELYKNLLSSAYDCKYGDVYCVLIAPCFDKKLEAAREEAKSGRAVIDLVLSTEELYRHILETDSKYLDPTASIEPSNMLSSTVLVRNMLDTTARPPNALYQSSFVPCGEFQLFKNFNRFGSSNGYADYILKRLDAEFGVASVEESIRKNKNFTEVAVQTKDDRQFRIALVYGFKNIQNLIRQIKTKKCKYDYVEIMACPSGCINGGGQIKSDDPLAKTKTIEEVYALYDQKETLDAFELVQRFVQQFNSSEKTTGVEKAFMLYNFEAIVNTNVQTITW